MFLLEMEMRGIKGLTAPFPRPPNPRSPGRADPTTSQSFPTCISSASLCSETHLAFNFFLTIPITSYTIALPASLRSDHLIGINRNADRHHAGALIDFTGIRTRFPICFPFLKAERPVC